jgi:2-desacetyl-2-hydroxyethyl bacteriochlorophyllide A dehydrogenase
MKAAVLTDLETISFLNKPVPEIGPGEVLLKVEYCGICGSDVHAYSNGVAMQVGTVMGHECSGVVSQVGANIQNVRLGDRVWVKPGAPCGECYWCRKGKYMYCPQGFERAMGLTPKYDGAFAEYVLVRYPHEMLFKLPSNVSFEEAALIEPLSVALHGVKVSRFKMGDRVVIVGAGMIGLGVLQYVRLGGAEKIIVLEKSQRKFQISKLIGADVVLDPVSEGDNLPRRIFELTNGIGADVVFECSGATSALQNTINYVSSGGQIILIGLHEKELPFNFWTLLHREVELKGSLGFINECDDVLRNLKAKKIRTDNLISDVISLADIEEKGFKRLLSSQDIVKILVRP